MKNVLIALDYNPSAQKVAETGYQLAKSMNAKVTLLHVVSDFTYYSSLNYSPIMGFESFSNAVETEGSTELKRVAKNYLDRSKQHLGDEAIQTIVKSGEFAGTILETANEVGANIIVMGTHSRRGLEKILVGSVAEKVLNHSLIPLFIIPTRSMEEN
ncbi:MAG TPA: universal stress protein [Cyclobacteriaceae bacterium]|jgi:nucleotide-binding universal stress UspA family protein|nr:universal stress protein [Cyclobacteriaceae bacterium]